MASLTDAFENDIFLSIFHGALITYKTAHKITSVKIEINEQFHIPNHRESMFLKLPLA